MPGISKSYMLIFRILTAHEKLIDTRDDSCNHLQNNYWEKKLYIMSVLDYSKAMQA